MHESAEWVLLEVPTVWPHVPCSQRVPPEDVSRSVVSRKTKPTKNKSAPWADAHRREALRRILEVVARLAGDGMTGDRAAYMCTFAVWASRSEFAFRETLINMGFGDVRINREVRRVDGLATGRLVRFDGYRVGVNFYTLDQHAMALAYAKASGFRCQRSRRIRVAR